MNSLPVLLLLLENITNTPLIAHARHLIPVVENHLTTNYTATCIKIHFRNIKCPGISAVAASENPLLNSYGSPLRYVNTVFTLGYDSHRRG
jgi:hypothetical protein